MMGFPSLSQFTIRYLLKLWLWLFNRSIPQWGLQRAVISSRASSSFLGPRTICLTCLCFWLDGSCMQTPAPLTIKSKWVVPSEKGHIHCFDMFWSLQVSQNISLIIICLLRNLYYIPSWWFLKRYMHSGQTGGQLLWLEKIQNWWKEGAWKIMVSWKKQVNMTNRYSEKLWFPENICEKTPVSWNMFPQINQKPTASFAGEILTKMKDSTV